MSVRQPLELPSYEYLSQLARDNPQGYEALRLELIESFIDSASESNKPRLCGIQFRVDSLRRLSKSSVGSTVRIYELMWKSFLFLNQNLQDLALIKAGPENKQGSTSGTDRIANGNARILEFRLRS